MKRFIITILSVAVFFVGLGSLVGTVSSKFKSDAKALEIIGKARQAVGGEAALAEVRSLIIKGQTTHTMKVDGADKTEQGQTEIVMQLPDKLMKMVKIGEGEMGEASAMKTHDVMILRKGDGAIAEGKDGEFTTADGKKIIVRKIEGGGHGDIASADGKKMKVKRVEHGGMRQNELLRFTLSLLLSAPEGTDVSYAYAGEGNIEGVAVNTVDASFAGSTFRLHFDKGTNLPVAMTYSGHKMPIIIRRTTKDGEPAVAATKEMKTFTHKIEGPGETAEHFVRFGDYRSVNGVQLPYKWTTSVGGQTTEVFDVTSFEVNPANIAERFDGQKIFVRTPKPVQN